MSEITEAIRAGLEREPDINPHADDIDVLEDDVIRLVGRVRDIRAKRKALQVARESGDTLRIHDELRLERGERQPDDRIADSVVRVLGSDQDFGDIPISRNTDVPLSPQGYGVHVVAVDAVVRLEGRMPSLNHRRLAEVLAWWVPGVTDVDNRVVVEPAEEDNDGEISEALRLVIEKDQALNADEINAVVRNAEATLAGRVASGEQAERAVLDCWFVPGVHEVKNELRIAP
jgi:osmotically-inducible protein OsmY